MLSTRTRSSLESLRVEENGSLLGTIDIEEKDINEDHLKKCVKNMRSESGELDVIDSSGRRWRIVKEDWFSYLSDV